MKVVWRVKGKNIRSVLYSTVCSSCAQCNAHTHINRPNSCLLDLASLWLYCMLQFICVRFSFLGLFCVIFYLCVCFCCVRFRFFSNMPTDGLARKHVSKMTYFAPSWTYNLNGNFANSKVYSLNRSSSSTVTSPQQAGTAPGIFV